MVIWVTGLSGSGKTTLCNELWRLLKPAIPELVFLDGDSIRMAVGDGLGHREEDRFVQIKRMQSFAQLLSEQDLVVIVAALYCHPDLLKWNRNNLPGYFEVYLEGSSETVRLRDTKNLYARADSGEITDVVSVDIPWHPPKSPDLVINIDNEDLPEAIAQRVVANVPRLSQA